MGAVAVAAAASKTNKKMQNTYMPMCISPQTHTYVSEYTHKVVCMCTHT
eukprot:NODE_1935_length_863_cov_380.507371_g1353_i0.p1 GENE.NODE_1935_length_863_cov_380.507371_g1353_i0~~NODE_1935_length_863_cov_380.507371_g1353_i0.p1  ORF type:complete len:59 (+),score=16.38 NODE_1935_length_863_cov_380.507371_g1353_i0:33-179(+)